MGEERVELKILHVLDLSSRGSYAVSAKLLQGEPREGLVLVGANRLAARWRICGLETERPESIEKGIRGLNLEPIDPSAVPEAGESLVEDESAPATFVTIRYDPMNVAADLASCVQRLRSDLEKQSIGLIRRPRHVEKGWSNETFFMSLPRSIPLDLLHRVVDVMKEEYVRQLGSLSPAPFPMSQKPSAVIGFEGDERAFSFPGEEGALMDRKKQLSGKANSQ